uniref:Uncharacterized protein n=1 Tax=Angiostrongylus cantonensis TaxID=6313 RepID=A0A0K0DFZ6_ANGCA
MLVIPPSSICVVRHSIDLSILIRPFWCDETEGEGHGDGEEEEEEQDEKEKKEEEIMGFVNTNGQTMVGVVGARSSCTMSYIYVCVASLSLSHYLFRQP